MEPFQGPAGTCSRRTQRGVKMSHSKVKIMNREIQMIQASHGGDFSNREGNELVETSD